MMRIALGIEYDGSGFCGWQVQDGTRTVQGCVEQALARVADHALRVVCAGRTDTGVHALGQVVHFDTTAQRPLHAWVLGANANLPPDVSVRWAQPVATEFHARFTALRRHYRYVIYNHRVRPALGAGRVAWDYRPLEVAAMNEAAAFLVGEHDFSSYRAYACQAKTPTRTV
ncbi:MAG: tRNA pseudouridine(38-40) synthase TruA, partial [Gammaproteobacteria bacterium]